MQQYKLKWLNEPIEKVEKNNGLYRLICALTFRKRMTYKQMYFLLQKMSEKSKGETESKVDAFKQVMEIYKYNNGKIPYEVWNGLQGEDN